MIKPRSDWTGPPIMISVFNKFKGGINPMPENRDSILMGDGLLIIKPNAPFSLWSQIKITLPENNESCILGMAIKK